MAKIIQLHNREIKSTCLNNEDGFEVFVNWVSEMNNLLHLIEKSIENTPVYEQKNLNSRR